MKTASWLLFLVLISGLSACMWGVPKKQGSGVVSDTLTYIYQKVEDRAPDCGSKPDSGCTVATIKYPVFKNAKLLNDSIVHKLTGLFGFYNKPDSSLQLMSDNFLKSYADFKKKDARPGMFFTLKSYASILRQDSSLVTLEVGGYSFQGGAHGATVVNFINWNTGTGKNVSLNDILLANYKEKLTKIGEAIFRKDEKLSDTASLANDYFFKGNKFALNNNFSITPLGIRFLYNSYEIKPYAAGRTILFIPYTQIKSLLRPNTVVSQFIK